MLRPHAAAIAATVVLLTVAAVLTACSGSSQRHAGAAPTATRIRALLSTHGADVRADRRAGFLAGISTTRAATAFRTRQAAAFDNLSQLPLGTWSYTLGNRTDDRSAEAAATRRYGTPAVIYQVTLRYALTGFDPVPTQHQLYWTFVDQDGRAVVAADDALADVGGASWRGPWDFGPLTVGRGSAVLVLAHAAAGNLTGLVDQVDAAVPAVTAVWGTDWPQRVVVLVPASADELAADAGPASQLTADTAASTVSDGSDPLTRAAYGLRMVVNPPALARLSAVGRGITLRHEITHVAIGTATTDSTPRWLAEGFAEYVGQLHSGQRVPVAAAELARAVRSGNVPAALPTEQDFDGTAVAAARAYEASWLACRLIAGQVGNAGLVRFYRSVGAGYDAQAAVGGALRAVLHTDVAAFTARWRAYLRQELR